MSFCSNCGEKIADGAVFCSNCGTKVGMGLVNAQGLKISNLQQPTQQPLPQTNPAQQPRQVHDIQSVVPGGTDASSKPVSTTKKKKKGLIIGITAGVVAILVAAGVALAIHLNSDNEDEAPKETPRPVATKKPEETPAPIEEDDFGGYPLEDAPKLTYWLAMNANMGLVVSNPGETEFAKELSKRTGVEIEYVVPGADANEDLTKRIVNDNLPDMVETAWVSFNGGAQQCLDDGIIIPLNEYIDKYAPNFKKYLEENPDIDRMIKTENGTYYCFPFIRGDERLLISTGPVYRRDWAEKAGLGAPKTVADIEEILKAYKKQGVSKPLSMSFGSLMSFAGNFSTSSGYYYNKDKKVVYGPTTDNFKFALETYNKWYKEGLLDKNFQSIASDELKAQILNGETGMTFTSGGGGLGTWLDEMAGKEFDMVGFTYTANKAGEKNTYHAVDINYPGYGSVAITKNCKPENIEAAVRFLDYGYSEEGHMFYNFGVEGEVYNIDENGKAEFTDIIKKNPDGWTQASAMTYYLRSSTQGPFVQHVDYIDQFYGRPNQQDTLDAWIADYADIKDYRLPNYTLTPEEEIEYSDLQLVISEYVNAEAIKFIKGERSFKEWNSFVKTVNDLGAKRTTAIIQASCDRYDNKK